MFRSVVHPASGELLDRGLALFFEEGSRCALARAVRSDESRVTDPRRSFTGEDVLELHVHGSPAVLDAVLGAAEGIEVWQWPCAPPFAPHHP